MDGGNKCYRYSAEMLPFATPYPSPLRNVLAKPSCGCTVTEFNLIELELYKYNNDVV